jgi:hypothetical protein
VIGDGVGADSLDSTSGCMVVIPSMWVVTVRALYSSACSVSSRSISVPMVLRVGDLDDPLKLDDK